MTKPKKLIEVAMPIKEVSAESVRDKSIRHGHISTLHLWWARRPLPACRAVVFASLVPDPLDANCPAAFREAVEKLLGASPYSPYPDIPYTSVSDPMDDNARNRLLMFIGKFSQGCQENMLAGISTTAKEQLSDGSLVKWENKNSRAVLDKARELIWVAYNGERHPEKDFAVLHQEFKAAYDAIFKAERAFYSKTDRHIPSDETERLQQSLDKAIESFQDRMPSVLDPFAGGGAIPLEAARLGCRSYGNDINPVAHIIERASAEFPQRYGKPIVYSEDEFRSRYGSEAVAEAVAIGSGIKTGRDSFEVPNRLSYDVAHYAKRILAAAEREVGHLYPADSQGRKPIAYYWARTARCSNPSCQAEVPLLKQFYLAKTSKKNVWLRPHISGTDISFTIETGKYDEKVFKGWNNRGNMTCPCCGSITNIEEVKRQSKAGGLKERLLAVISEDDAGKTYALADEALQKRLTDNVKEVERPQENMMRNSNGGDTFPWGYTKWGQLFSPRQLYMLQTFIEQFNAVKRELQDAGDYGKALLTYLAIWIDRIALVNTSLGRWNNPGEKIEHPFSRQAIAMTFDYPESNPFCGRTGSAMNQLEWIMRYLESESGSPFPAGFANASSGEKTQFPAKTITAAVTDPPYYDAIAYADCSDFFYVWMKRTLGDLYPLNFATPQTPKAEECTALKHHHEGSEAEAKRHFERKLTQIFDAIETQTEDIVSIMFAHQSTEAWTTLCNSILNARMNITGSWPIDTEMPNRTLGLAGAALESSVTVACRPSVRSGYGDYKEVRRNIQTKVSQEVEKLYALGFRGADLLTACFGQAAGEFGSYATVEKSDGSEVTVSELLELAKHSAFNALIKGIEGDDYTRFYYGWLYINGAGEADHDDITKFTRIGMDIDKDDIYRERLVIQEGGSMHLAMAEEHLGSSTVQGTAPEHSGIEQVHRAILLYRDGNREKLLDFVRNVAPEESSPLWRLLATLKELLPDNDDLKQVKGLLQGADDLRQKCNVKPKTTQGTFDFQD